MANEKKIVAVKARSISPHGFWRCGRLWEAVGSVHELEPTELARVRAEPNLIVVATGKSIDEILSADEKSKAEDARLLELASERATRKSIRSRVNKYNRVEAVREHIAEIESDINSEGCTEYEKLNLAEEKLKLIDIAKSFATEKK